MSSKPGFFSLWGLLLLWFIFPSDAARKIFEWIEKRSAPTGEDSDDAKTP